MRIERRFPTNYGRWTLRCPLNMSEVISRMKLWLGS